jgi:molybdenum cofactor cytidylyltransferase
MERQSNKALIRTCVLAAGTSRRFGATKLVQPLRGRPIVQHALLAAAGACGEEVCLVIGHDQDSVLSASAGLCHNVVVNAEYQDGIGTSIAAGVRACGGGADAVIVLLGDQPLVTTAHLRSLIDKWSGADNQIIASVFEGVKGPPILFPRKAFAALMELEGDSGAKSLLADANFDVSSVDCPQAGIDVDTPEMLIHLDQT